MNGQNQKNIVSDFDYLSTKLLRQEFFKAGGISPPTLKNHLFFDF